MKGKVLDFAIGENSGAIAGDDGHRYQFSGPDWKAQAVQPRPGTRVDFVPESGTATQIYVDVAPGGGAVESQGLDERYRSLYCSSDERIIFGLCGGLAHKFDVPVAAVRFVVFLSMFVVVGWLYFVGLFLPKLPTRGVARPT